MTAIDGQPIPDSNEDWATAREIGDFDESLLTFRQLRKLHEEMELAERDYIEGND